MRKHLIVADVVPRFWERAKAKTFINNVLHEKFRFQDIRQKATVDPKTRCFIRKNESY